VFIGWGQIDDLIVLGVVIWYIVTGNVPGVIKQKFFRTRGNSDHQHSSHQQQSHSDSQNIHSKMTPHEILGVSPTASKDEIRTAYRKLANQYHPDKVHHLGTEFQQLAEAKFKAIQEAYQKLMNN
jgi:DnaJ-domain-containing protein 1